MSKTLLSSPEYITWFFSLHRDCHFLLQNQISFFLITSCSLILFPCLRVLMPLVVCFFFQLKRITTILSCVKVPNNEVDIPTHQNLCYCQFDEQHTYKIHQKCQKPTPSRKFSCLKKQKHGTFILYIPAIANRLLPTLKSKCSAHSWCTPDL